MFFAPFTSPLLVSRLCIASLDSVFIDATRRIQHPTVKSDGTLGFDCVRYDVTYSRLCGVTRSLRDNETGNNRWRFSVESGRR